MASTTARAVTSWPSPTVTMTSPPDARSDVACWAKTMFAPNSHACSHAR